MFNKDHDDKGRDELRRLFEGFSEDVDGNGAGPFNEKFPHTQKPASTVSSLTGDLLDATEASDFMGAVTEAVIESLNIYDMNPALLIRILEKSPGIGAAIVKQSGWKLTASYCHVANIAARNIDPDSWGDLTQLEIALIQNVNGAFAMIHHEVELALLASDHEDTYAWAWPEDFNPGRPDRELLLHMVMQGQGAVTLEDHTTNGKIVTSAQHADMYTANLIRTEVSVNGLGGNAIRDVTFGTSVSSGGRIHRIVYHCIDKSNGKRVITPDKAVISDMIRDEIVGKNTGGDDD